MAFNDRKRALKVDFLWYPECPSHPQALEMLNDVLRELDVEAEINEQIVETQAEAEALAFPGSPTIRIEGADIDAEGAGSRPALTCRTYRWKDGRFQPLPERSLLVSAFQRATEVHV